MRCYCLAGSENKRNVWLAVFRQWRWNTNENCLDFAHPAEIGGRRKSPSCNCRRNDASFNMLDVALTSLEPLDLFSIDIKSKHCHARARKLQRQRQPNISQTNDGDFHLRLSPLSAFNF